MVKYKNDYRKLLESKGFVLNNYPEDGKFWELVIKDDEDLKQHICKVFKTDVELLDSNIDKVILQCAEDYSRCVFYYDCNPYNMETEEFMKCVENIGMIRKLAKKDLLSLESELDELEMEANI